MRTRTRGRGGRVSSSGTSRGASKNARGSLAGSRKLTRSISNISTYSDSFGDGQHQEARVHATWERPWLVVSGLRPEHFDNWMSENDDQDESQSQVSFRNRFQRLQSSTRWPDENADGQRGSDAERSDWTETEEEIIVEPKTRGFYRPPLKREVVRKRVRKSESSRYTENGHLRPPTSSKATSTGRIASRRQSHSTSSARGDDQVAGDDEAPTIEEELEREPRRQLTRETSRIQQADEEEENVPPNMVDEGELSDSEFPPPFLDRPPTPNEADCDDAADFIVKTRFLPMSDPQAFIRALTKYPLNSRHTDVLYQLALNTQRALKEWQDEYLLLDLRTAPNANPPKKPMTGGRGPLDPQVFEDMKEADLYGYAHDPKKGPGQQDPFRQREGGGDLIGGRELRHRRAARDVGGDASEGDVTGTEGYGTRRRKAMQRYEGESRTASARGTKRMLSSGTPDADAPPRKRGRPSAAEKAALQNRIRQLREESAAMSTSSEADGRSPEPPRRRGRPPGSKNTQPRSDAGIKKGPRKAKIGTPQAENETSVNGVATEATNAPTPVSQPPSFEEVTPSVETIEQPVFQNEPAVPAQPQHSNPKQQPPQRLPEDHDQPTFRVNEMPQTEQQAPPPTGDGMKDPKKRVRSEKRSKSMTEWWAARKAKAAEDRKQQELAQQAEANRIAEEQARAQAAQQPHTTHQSPYPPPEGHYWNPQHQHPHMMPPQQQYSQGAPFPTQPPPPPNQYASSPTQTSPSQAHAFVPQQIQFPPPHPPPPAQKSSPLRKIINYVSDPTAAAQPSGPPYQTIMTPGASRSPIMYTQPQPPTPVPAKTPTTTTGSFGAFHVQVQPTRTSIPGTSSFRPRTPATGRTLPHLAPSGKMTGAQVQDLHLAAVQPPQRRKMEDVLHEQQQRQEQQPPPSQRPLYPIHPHPGPPPSSGPPGSQHSPIYPQQPQHPHSGPPPYAHLPSSHLSHLPALAPAPPMHQPHHQHGPPPPGASGPPTPPQGPGAPPQHQAMPPAFSQGGSAPGQPLAPAPMPSQQQQQPQGPQMRFVAVHGDGRRGSRGKS